MNHYTVPVAYQTGGNRYTAWRTVVRVPYQTPYHTKGVRKYPWVDGGTLREGREEPSTPDGAEGRIVDNRKREGKK